MKIASSPCPERELLLHGLADRELDAANTLFLEEHLKVCCGCAAAYRDILLQKEILDESTRYKAPDALRERIMASLGPPAIPKIEPSSLARSNWRSASAALAASAFALAASVVIFFNSSNPTTVLESDLVAGHVRSLLASHLTDVVSSDQHTVKPWFLGKLDFSPSVVDLKSRGFPLVGGRLDYIDGHVVPAIVYKRDGHVINVFVWPTGKLERAPQEELDGYHILSWTEFGFNYAAVSDLNWSELRDFQNAFADSFRQ